MRVTSASDCDSIPIRIISHNIRYATTNPFPGELPWPDRASGLISELLYHTRHCAESFICLQEVLHSQLLHILNGLNAAASREWSYIGVGRDDGKEWGEYSPILYRTGSWNVQHFFTTWLSPTPFVAGSKGWDAACVRILTTGVFMHASTGRKISAMNTHLDDQGRVSRWESTKLILSTIEKVAREVGYDATFLAGDLNSEISGEAYEVLNADGSGMVDMRTLIKFNNNSYANDMTFTGFNGHGDDESKATRIDFIHLGVNSSSNNAHLGPSLTTWMDRGVHAINRPAWEVQGYAVLPNRFDDGVYISDHRAVVGDVLLK